MQIIDSPLHQQWSVDLYGRIGLTVVFKMEGESVELFVNGPESVGYANFGGAQWLGSILYKFTLCMHCHCL
jgi:hypothetical protein